LRYLRTGCFACVLNKTSAFSILRAVDFRIGTLDIHFELLPLFLDHQRQIKNETAFFLAGYFSTLFQRQPEQWERTLDLMTEDPLLAHHVPEVTWRSGMTERAARRILSLAKSGVIEPLSFRMFSYGRVVRRIPQEVFSEWLDWLVAEGSRTAASTALDLFHFYYTLEKPPDALPRNDTLKVLTARALFESKAESRGYQREDYDWAQVADAFLDQYTSDGPVIAEALLSNFGERGTITGHYNGEAERILTRIARENPVFVWKEISEHLGPPIDSRAFHLRQWLRDGGLMAFTPTALWKWIDADIENRAWYAATLVPSVLFHSTSDVCWARELLVRYGDLQEVRNNLHANFNTEGWVGPASQHYETKKRALEEFKRDETNPNVLLWIEEAIASLNHQIEQAHIQEEREF
jgi:hypothetical protein